MSTHESIVEMQQVAREECKYTHYIQIGNKGQHELIVQDRNGEYYPLYEQSRERKELPQGLPF